MTRTVAGGKRWNLLGLGIAAGGAALAVFAWVDGGREPLREIIQPVPLPGAGK